ncbi:MAG: hypothetical protein ABJ000_05335 [Saccharospirillum sp.]|uniref:hypothetical protein n=1 Tax=Saccharospirillum sp. TaxID=2033801 RepID=UPI0032981C18
MKKLLNIHGGNVLVNVTKSYLDIARSVTRTKIGTKDESVEIDEALFGLMSCNYVYSYSALLSFCSAQLYILWDAEHSTLKARYSKFESFEKLMSSELRSVKTALKVLIEELNLKPLHSEEPKLWQNLTELLKNYRDFFLHPNPEKFHEHVESAGNKSWGLASSTVEGILSYIFLNTSGNVPSWVFKSELECDGFRLVDI